MNRDNYACPVVPTRSTFADSTKSTFSIETGDAKSILEKLQAQQKALYQLSEAVSAVDRIVTKVDQLNLGSSVYMDILHAMKEKKIDTTNVLFTHVCEINDTSSRLLKQVERLYMVHFKEYATASNDLFVGVSHHPYHNKTDDWRRQYYKHSLQGQEKRHADMYRSEFVLLGKSLKIALAIFAPLMPDPLIALIRTYCANPDPCCADLLPSGTLSMGHNYPSGQCRPCNKHVFKTDHHLVCYICHQIFHYQKQNQDVVFEYKNRNCVIHYACCITSGIDTGNVDLAQYIRGDLIVPQKVQRIPIAEVCFSKRHRKAALFEANIDQPKII